MDATNANLQIFFTGLSTQFRQGYTKIGPWAGAVATTVPSDTELETYGWMDAIGQVTEWIGPRSVNAIPTQSRSVTNRNWQRTDSITRPKFEDDKFALFGPRAEDMGQAAAKLHDIQIVKLMQSTATTQSGPAVTGNPVCFDGVTFFNASHPVDVTLGATAQYGTYSNDFPNNALTFTNYELGRANMRGYIGRDGIVYGILPNMLIVPPQLEGIAKLITTSKVVAPGVMADGTTMVGGQDNIWAGSAGYMVIDELQNQPKVWYLADFTRAIRPFLIQKRKDFVFVPRVSITDDNVFWDNEFVWGCDGRFAYDVTLPFMIERHGTGL